MFWYVFNRQTINSKYGTQMISSEAETQQKVEWIYADFFISDDL